MLFKALCKSCYLQHGFVTKTLLVMKLTSVLLLSVCLQAHAASYGQSISLSVKNASLEKVFEEIKKQTGYSIFFNYRLIEKAHPVTLHIRNEAIGKVLEACLHDQGLDYEIENGSIVITRSNLSPPAPITSLPPPLEIHGTVTDDKGLPLAGASVVIRGTHLGTATDEKGQFTIHAEQGSSLEVTLLGYTMARYRVTDGKAAHIVLAIGASDLNDVVIVGYGTQKRENLTSAVGTIGSASLGDRPTSSPANLLQGLAAGLTVTTQGSYPGAGANIKIREISSWQGGTSPLFVIDGFVRDSSIFATINPADIDNISILKDAASAAIYGIKGGNGVILVTTKHGVADKTTINYSGSYTLYRREVTPRRMNAYDSYLFADQAYDQKNIPSTDPGYYSDDELEYFRTHSYDWLKETWRNPWNTNHNLSMSGGSKAARYYVSGSFLRQEGATSNSFNKYSVLAKLDGQITKRLSYNLNFNAEWDNSSRPFWAYDNGDFNLSNLYNRLLMASPGRPAFINGMPVANFDNTNTAALAEGQGGYTRPSNNYITPTFQLKYDIPGITGLSARGTIAYNSYNNYTKGWRNAPYIYYFKTAGANNHIVTDVLDSSLAGGYKILDQAQTAGVGAPTQLTEGYIQSHNYQLDLMLNYEHAFGGHHIAAFAGYEQSAYRGHFSNITDNNYSNTGFQQINGGSSNTSDWYIRGDELQPTGFASWLGRVDYDYQSRYMLGLTFRADGSYVFPANHRWGYFPSVSAAWNIGKEDFFQGLTHYLEVAKIRMSYGLTGSDNTIPWQWQQNYTFNSSSGIYLGSGSPPAITLGSTINPDITWERNHNYDVGIDLSMPRRFLSFTADWWYKRTKDILGARNASVPVTVGATLPNVNYGIAAAHGLELSLSHSNTIGAIYYSAGVNWAISDNKFVRLDQAASVRDYQNMLGRPINGVITGYVSEGIIRTQDQASKLLAENPGYTILGSKPQPGMLQYKDLRGPLGTNTPDGLVDGNDQNIISTYGVPRINYGFNFTIGWKGLQLMTIFSGLAHYQVMPTDVYYRRPLPGQTNLSIWKGAWTPATAAVATLPSAVMNDWQGTSNAEQNSSFWLLNGALLRLKTLNLSYTLPSGLFHTNQITGVRVYFTGENLHLWSHVKDWDPELGGDFRTYPVMTGYTFGLNVSF
jgi:TonB-linked SusC/RagA family outer membrane protein